MCHGSGSQSTKCRREAKEAIIREDMNQAKALTVRARAEGTETRRIVVDDIAAASAVEKAESLLAWAARCGAPRLSLDPPLSP